MRTVAGIVVVTLILGGLPAWVVWGWTTWIRRRPVRLSLGMRCSLAGFVLASASAFLEIASGICELLGVPLFLYQSFSHIYRWGFLLALCGLIAGLFGVASKTPLRWKAPALSLVLVLLWRMEQPCLGAGFKPASTISRTAGSVAARPRSMLT